MVRHYKGLYLCNKCDLSVSSLVGVHSNLGKKGIIGYLVATAAAQFRPDVEVVALES